MKRIVYTCVLVRAGKVLSVHTLRSSLPCTRALALAEKAGPDVGYQLWSKGLLVTAYFPTPACSPTPVCTPTKAPATTGFASTWMQGLSDDLLKTVVLTVH